MILEFVGGGPLDGEVLPCHGEQVRVASRKGIVTKFHRHATPDLVARVPHHLYEMGMEECGDGCCSRGVMIYVGEVGPDT